MTPVLVGIAAIIALGFSLILRLASIHPNVFLTWQTFLIIGLLCWVIYDVLWGRAHHGGPA